MSNLQLERIHLESPVDLTDVDFSTPCAIREIVEGAPECQNEATLIIRMHTCNCAVSCAKCWQRLRKSMASKGNGLPQQKWHCAICKKAAPRYEDLIWSEPL
jgi:hypothetical protein